MKDYIIFNDAGYGVVELGASNKKNFTFTDKKSNKKRSLLANIEMTHSGIMTLNKGFYLPDSMNQGASTFTDNYMKPVLNGHDADTDPIGRVIKSSYVDTSNQYRMKDSNLSSMMQFLDKKTKAKSKTEEMIDFTHYVMDNYLSKDSYKGMGHVLGRLKIDDEEAIEKVLDLRYLTVSVAISSDAAYCSECGQDWVSEGPCDHQRGKIYDSGFPVVLIPGSMKFNHVGVVSEPADIHAAGFSDIKIVNGTKSNTITQDCISEDNCNCFRDKYSNVIELFSYDKENLCSLRDDKQTNLLDIKDEIQEIETSLKTMENNMEITLDSVMAKIELYKSGENADGKWESTEISVRKYVEELDDAGIKKLAEKALAALEDAKEESEIEKVLMDTFSSEYNLIIKDKETEDSEEENAEETEDKKKCKKEKKKTTDAVEDKDIFIFILDDNFKVVEGTDSFKESELKTLIDSISEIAGKDLKKKEMKELADALLRTPLNDVIYSREDLIANELKDSVTTYIAAKENRLVLADAVEEEIVKAIDEALEAKSQKLPETIDDNAKVGVFPIVSRDSFDIAQSIIRKSEGSFSLKGRLIGAMAKKASTIVEVNDEVTPEENKDSSNYKELEDEKLLALEKEIRDEIEERELDSIVDSVQIKELSQEIAILELQLDAANEETFLLQDKIQAFEADNKEKLIDKIVSLKVEKKLISEEEIKDETEKLEARTEDSLKDSLEDLTKEKSQAKIEELGQIDDPTFSDAASNEVETIVEGTDQTIEIKDRKMKRSAAFLKASGRANHFLQK